MSERPFGKTNHFAVVGFLLPFAAAGIAAGLILLIQRELWSVKFLVPYLFVVPLLLLAGLGSSLRSIPLIPEKNDKDYAYSGLTLNILFIVIYIIFLFYTFS